MTVLTEQFFNDHITFTAAQSLRDIARPLKALGINYFTYDNNYEDGSHIRLTTHPDWIEHYYRASLYNRAIFEKDISLFKSGYVFWDWLNREPIYSEAAEYDIDHGLTITIKRKNRVDFYHFGTSRHTPIAKSFLADNISFLYRFIHHFHEKAKKMIEQAEQSKVALLIDQRDVIHSHQLSNILHDTRFIDFINTTEVKKLYLGDPFDNAYLTRREIDIVQLLVQGKKTHSIASELTLSDRTTEVHIANIKRKFKCDTLFELGYKLANFGLDTVFPFEIKD